MKISDLPIDVKNKILQHVKELRRPKKVLSNDLKMDIESRRWLNDILYGMYILYKNKNYCLDWMESDLLLHLNDYKHVEHYLSNDIFTYYYGLSRNEIIYELYNDHSKLKNIHKYWNIMSIRRRKLFTSKYGWCIQQR